MMQPFVITSSFDWCIRYFKTYYPKESWDSWSTHLYWGHFHDYLEAPYLLRRLDGDYCFCKSTSEHAFVVLHPIEGERTYLKTLQSQFFFNEVLGYQHALQFQFDKSLSKQIIQQFLHFLCQKPKQFLGVLSVFFAYEWCSLIEPFGLSFLIDHLDFFSKNIDFVLVGSFLALGMGLVWSLSYVKQRLSLYCLGINARYFSNYVWSRYFLSTLTELSKQKIGDVYPQFFALDQIAYRLLQQFVNLSFDVFFFGLNVMILGGINLQLAVIDLFSFISLIGLSMILIKSYQRNSREVLNKQQQLHAFSLDVLQHMNETKLWQREHVIFGKWKEKNLSYWQAFLSNEFQQFKLEWLIDGIKKVNFLIIIISALLLIKEQALSLGLFMAYLSLKMQVFGRFEGVLRRLNQSQYYKAPLEKLSSLFQKMKSLKTSKLSRNRSENQDIKIEAIEFGELHFKNMVFQRGQNYLIEGPSGRGKTSLLKAMIGLASPLTAKIIYRGQDCQLDDWLIFRQEVAVVFADQTLWQASLIDNITMFEKQVDMPFINSLMSDLGLDTLIEKSLSSISAGQAQKILLARALYRRPEWIILDEATCHLDEASEEDILKKILNYPCSFIVVNHRQHVAKFFDQCLLWDELCCGQH